MSYVVENKEMAIEKAMEMANIIAVKSPVAVQGTKILLDYSRDHSVREGIYSDSWCGDTDFSNGVYGLMEFNLFSIFGMA